MKPARAYPDVATYLKETHTTQEMLAERLEISPSYLSMILSGQRMPPLDLAIRIAAETNVPVESLVRSPNSIAS